MATKKKTSSKLFTKKVHAVVKSDVFTSIAIASVLLNVLFLISIFVLTSTSTFDRKLFVSAKNRYCENGQSLKARTAELGSEKAALQERSIDCTDSSFRPFYKEAIDKYRAQSN